MPDFEPFPKLARLNRAIFVTEKLDGTNAAVGVTADGEVYAQSRKRLIVPGDDNYGFAAWVAAHEDELREGLGQGLHFGEWWGQGIQRGYGLEEKRFSLFNVDRWKDGQRPECCHVVPTLAINSYFDTDLIESVLIFLRAEGSSAAPGFMKPEGAVVYHTAANTMFKVTLEHDEVPKSQVRR